MNRYDYGYPHLSMPQRAVGVLERLIRRAFRSFFHAWWLAGHVVRFVMLMIATAALCGAVQALPILTAGERSSLTALVAMACFVFVAAATIASIFRRGRP